MCDGPFDGLPIKNLLFNFTTLVIVVLPYISAGWVGSYVEFSRQLREKEGKDWIGPLVQNFTVLECNYEANIGEETVYNFYLHVEFFTNYTTCEDDVEFCNPVFPNSINCSDTHLQGEHSNQYVRESCPVLCNTCGLVSAQLQKTTAREMVEPDCDNLEIYYWSEDYKTLTLGIFADEYRGKIEKALLIMIVGGSVSFFFMIVYEYLRCTTPREPKLNSSVWILSFGIRVLWTIVSIFVFIGYAPVSCFIWVLTYPCHKSQYKFFPWESKAIEKLIFFYQVWFTLLGCLYETITWEEMNEEKPVEVEVNPNECEI